MLARAPPSQRWSRLKTAFHAEIRRFFNVMEGGRWPHSVDVSYDDDTLEHNVEWGDDLHPAPLDPARSEAFAGRMKGTATTEGTIR